MSVLFFQLTIVAVVFTLAFVARRFGGSLSTLASMPAMAAGRSMTGAEYQAGTIAQRLGLSLTAGAPTDDLMMVPAHVLAPAGHGQTVERSIRLEGAPRGRPIEVVDFTRKVNKPDGWASSRVTVTTWQQLHVAAKLRVRVPEFEVISKRSSLGIPMPHRELPLPVVSVGDPTLDDELTFAGDPQVLAAVGSVVAQLDPSLRAYGVHLVCTGHTVRFAFDRGRFGTGMYFAEQLVWALEAIADHVERRAHGAAA